MMVSVNFSIPCPVNATEEIPGVTPACGGDQCPATGGGGGGGLDFVTTQNSSTVTLTGAGTPSSPLRAETILEPVGVFTRAEFIIYAGNIALTAGSPAIVYVAPEETRFAANFADSIGSASSEVTGVLEVQKNGATVGSINIAAGVVTFTSAGFTLLRGDIMTLIPSTTFTPQFLAVTLVALVPVTYEAD